eukprot:5417470-Alexandrium_andersonii.AAC.1
MSALQLLAVSIGNHNRQGATATTPRCRHMPHAHSAVQRSVLKPTQRRSDGAKKLRARCRRPANSAYDESAGPEWATTNASLQVFEVCGT